MPGLGLKADIMILHLHKPAWRCAVCSRVAESGRGSGLIEVRLQDQNESWNREAAPNSSPGLAYSHTLGSGSEMEAQP
jgi:hypothetical protein